MNRQAAAHSPFDILIVTAVCFGIFILGSIQSVASGFPATAFSDSVFFEIITTELILGAAALGYLYHRGHDLSRFIPMPTLIGSLTGLALYALATMAGSACASIFAGAGLSGQPIDQMVAGATFSLAPLIGVSIINGLYEELFLIGYLQRALEGHGAAFAIGVSLLVRMSYHLYQGPVAAVSILGFGAVLSLYYWRTRKLWPIVVAHMAADLLAFLLS